ncbi:MAG: YggS family pyridoxal phosphate-dependent enzyme, partial [Candidatus Omnitrophica bacterium]|nr:YggS family pyridoxal phosphate-dependent enzyme [Candidatus Omnitrophota bacterium]
KENIEKVRQRVFAVCARNKIDPGKITILCVTKGRSVGQILEVVNSGIDHLGENRVQEAAEKYKLVTPAHWQMVGHLQSNKVRDALGIFDLIHSVDSVSLAQEINKQAVKINKIQDILLEVKTSPEVRKFGFKPQALAEVCEEIMKFQNVKIKGLMTIAPFTDNAQEARPYFAKLKALRDKLNPSWLLSMGMSSDFEVAIEEGADIIRLGRVIFDDNV